MKTDIANDPVLLIQLTKFQTNEILLDEQFYPCLDRLYMSTFLKVFVSLFRSLKHNTTGFPKITSDVNKIRIGKTKIVKTQLMQPCLQKHQIHKRYVLIYLSF